MRESLRGYADARLAEARREGRAERVHEELASFAALVAGDDVLRPVLCDPTIPAVTRRAIADDLLAAGADPTTIRLVGSTVATEKAADLVGSLAWLAGRANQETRLRDGEPPDPHGGKTATQERLEGYATAVFEDTADEATIETVEDDLFRFARIIEGTEELRACLTDPALGPELRAGVVDDLLGDRVNAATKALATYAATAGRAREIVASLDWLVERAAAERNLRIADVRSTVDLDAGQRARLAAALQRLTGRMVRLRVSVDPEMIGGIVVLVGDTIFDGSVRTQLERLRTRLATATAEDPRTQMGDRS
jgi:F-type H+-transporting ATPase subunit delta